MKKMFFNNFGPIIDIEIKAIITLRNNNINFSLRLNSLI